MNLSAFCIESRWAVSSCKTLSKHAQAQYTCYLRTLPHDTWIEIRLFSYFIRSLKQGHLYLNHFL